MFSHPRFGAVLPPNCNTGDIGVKVFCLLYARMPRGRKRKEESNSDSGRDEAAEEGKDESRNETSLVKRKKESPKSLTFKIEHW